MRPATKGFAAPLSGLDVLEEAHRCGNWDMAACGALAADFRLPGKPAPTSVQALQPRIATCFLPPASATCYCNALKSV